MVQSSGSLKGLRMGKWKYIAGKEDNSDSETSSGQLYDLDNDPSESKNIYADHPAIVEKMKNQMEEILQGDRSVL